MIVSETTMFLCCFIDASLRQHWRSTDDFVLSINNHQCFFVFNVLICETLIFFSWLSDDLLMIPWGNIDETAKNLMQAPMIIYIFNVLISESLLFRSCFIDVSLMTLWKTIDDATKIFMQKLRINEVSNALNFKALMF